MNNHLHIISFNVPFPPDYGGVIDVFYKIKALQKVGIKITLHCFQYGRAESKELSNLCHAVHYYKRNTGLFSQLSYLPYILYSRRSPDLIRNLINDNDPVLFEGLHSTYYLGHKSLKGREKIVRTHNIEHRYYWNLFLSESGLRQRVFFLLESIRLFFAQNRLRHSNLLATISENDFHYFSSRFANVFLLNAFHSAERLECLPGKGEYFLFHGNLSVPENIKGAVFLIEKVFAFIPFKVVIAGKDPSPELIAKIEKFKHIRLTSSPEEVEMKELIRNAHAIVLFSFQSTGTKLKLLESLFYGRYCIINSLITGDTKLSGLCRIADTANDLITCIRDIQQMDFGIDQIEARKKVLSDYHNRTGALQLMEKISDYN